MMIRLRRLRDVLAVLVVVFTLVFLAGSLTASFDLPAPVAISGEVGSDGQEPSADEEETMAADVAAAVVLMLGIGLWGALLLRGGGALTGKARGPPRAFVTGSPVTVLGA